MTLIERIRQLVSEGETEKSIEELIRYVRENQHEATDQLILLKSRMKNLNRALIEGTIDDEAAQIERAKISESVLKILKEITPAYLDTGDQELLAPQSTKTKPSIAKWMYLGGAAALAIMLLAYILAQTVPVKPTQAVEIQLPAFEHNQLINNVQYMKIWLPGRLLGYRGHQAQLSTHFSYNGQLLQAHSQEQAYRDPAGNVACGTAPFAITSDDFYITGQVMYIPYYALNLIPTGGKTTYQLLFFVEVFVDGVSVKVTPYQSFQVVW